MSTVGDLRQRRSMLASGATIATEADPAISWIDFRFRAVYVGAIFGTAWTLVFWGVTDKIAWTFVNMLHFVGTFIFFHTLKGTPFEFNDQGKYDRLTLWEQMDGGVQYSFNRKFFSVSPIVLFLLTSHYTDYDSTLFMSNLAVCLVLVIAKLPVMMRRRWFVEEKHQ